MNSKLNHIQNWPELACEVKWSVSTLAKNLRVSVRTLERHFLKQFEKSPKTWLVQDRQCKARILLVNGNTVKETASDLGYQHPTHLSRDFKKFWGRCPVKTFDALAPERTRTS